jgi:large subunit ribosomal protein L7Ae
MVGTQVSKEIAERTLEAIEAARSSGKIRKGANEVTKALEKGQAKLVAVAKDVTPPEIVMHLPVLAAEKGIACIEIPTKEELGAAAGLPLGTTAVAIIVEGEAKNIIKDVMKAIGK